MSMLPMVGVPIDRWLGSPLFLWLQLLLSTPVVLWGGGRSLNGDGDRLSLAS